MPEGYKIYSKEFDKINNPLPEEFTNKIINADCVSVLKKLPDNCVDLVFTSPPYNFGMEYDSHDDTQDWKRYFDDLFGIFKECIRVVKYGGRIIVNVQPFFSEYIPTHHEVSKFFMEQGLIWKAEILWEKNHRNCSYTSWGSWKSPSGPYFKYTWEYLEVFCKGSLKHFGDSKNADITANEFKTWVDAKWSIAPEHGTKSYGHPAMFPPELVYRALKVFSFKGDVILDPFNGAGTTTFVANATSRRYLGTDISEDYCKIAEKRIQTEQLKDYTLKIDEIWAVKDKIKDENDKKIELNQQIKSKKEAHFFNLFDQPEESSEKPAKSEEIVDGDDKWTA